MHHYVLITHLKGLIREYKQVQLRIDNHLCRNCFHDSTSLACHEKLEQICHQNRQAIKIMPTGSQKNFQFRNVQARWFVPIVSFFDLESIIEPTHQCRNNPNFSETQLIEYHRPCSFALLFLDLANFSSEACMNLKQSNNRMYSNSLLPTPFLSVLC